MPRSSELGGVLYIKSWISHQTVENIEISVNAASMKIKKRIMDDRHPVSDWVRRTMPSRTG
jgi:hypothetical protein